MFYAPFLPSHYRLSSAVRSEIDFLTADLGLELVSKSRMPIYGPLDCIQIERMFDQDFGFAVRFRLNSIPTKSDISASRALCERLSERNHKRYVHKPCYNHESLPLDW